MTRVVALAIVLATASAHADEPDPRGLFKDGRYDAAAAGFEKRFDRDRTALAGVNAVVAWRAAGHYAHARTLLLRVRTVVPRDNGELAARVELLDRKMAELTGTIILENVLPESTVLIDGKPPESESADRIVDVGIREIVVSHEGCDPLRRNIAVLPDQRVTLDVALTCAAKNGNLHVRIDGIGADAYVDGTKYDIPTKDLDIPTTPGRHHLVVRRIGVTIEDTDIDVPARGTALRHVALPFRARKVAVTVSGVSGIAASGDGESSSYAGIGVGIVTAMDAKQRGLGVIEVDFGAVHNSVEGLGDESAYIGMYGGFRFLGPLWQRRFGDALLTLDVDPISIRLLAISKGAYIDNDNVFKDYWLFGSATLGLDWKGGQLALVAWPAGISTWGAKSLDALRASYCGSMMVTLDWPVVGF